MRKVQRRFWWIKIGNKLARNKYSKKLWARKIRHYNHDLSSGSEYKKIGSQEKYKYMP